MGSDGSQTIGDAEELQGPQTDIEPGAAFPAPILGVRCIRALVNDRRGYSTSDGNSLRECNEYADDPVGSEWCY